jgi:serine/threonine protein kinase
VPLAAWEQEGIFYMLFPKAECSLKELLQQSAPSASVHTFRQLIQQLINLTEALDSIHNMRSPLAGAQTFATEDPHQPENQNLAVPLDRLQIRRQTGYHHDLKPANILVFPGGNWTINDFGTARIHEAVANSSYRTPNMNGGDSTYAPPDHQSKGQSSRPYDIWSLGCIFLEILIWIFSSGSGHTLKDFSSSRLYDIGGGTPAFWYIRDGKPKLRPSVKRAFADLKDATVGKSQFPVLTEWTRKMLSPDPRGRPEASQLLSRLKAMQQEAMRAVSRDETEADRLRSRYYPATLHSQGRTVEDGPNSPARSEDGAGATGSQLSAHIGSKRRRSSASNDGVIEWTSRPRFTSPSAPELQLSVGAGTISELIPSIVLDETAVYNDSAVLDDAEMSDRDITNTRSVIPPDMKLDDFRPM